MIVAFYAGLLGLLYLALTAYVIAGRYKHRVGIGDAGQPDMARRIRLHGNFAEYVPLILLLLYMAGNLGLAPLWLHSACAALLVGRVCHALALARSDGPTVLRGIGMLTTFFALLTGIAACLYFAAPPVLGL